MLDLLKIEYKKIIPYKTFWVIFGIVIIGIPILFYAVGQIKFEEFFIDFSTLYRFPNVWNNLSYFSSFFNFLLGLFVVILVCNEFSFKTFKQQVIDGQDKIDFIISKILLLTSFAVICSFYLFIVGSIFGFTAGNAGNGNFLDEVQYILIYFISAIGFMSFALLLAVVIRNTALSMLLFLFAIPIESTLQIIAPNASEKYFPMEIIANLTPKPEGGGMVVQEIKNIVVQEPLSLNTNLTFALIYIIAFWGVAYFFLLKKDIK